MRILDKIVSLSSALILAQFPQFFEQYLNQMRGHLGELNYQASIIDQSAKIAHKTVPELIGKFLSSSDGDFQRQGALMQGIMDRLQLFSQAISSLQSSGAFSKPFYFLRYADADVLKDTLTHFRWGFVFTLESLGYLLVGLLLGHFLFSLVKRIGKSRSPSPKKPIA
ncbi:MAG: DUF2937 family protein [Parachlamydiaceae bacterium]